MDATSELAARSEATHRGRGPGALDLDPQLVMELGLIDTLDAIRGAVEAPPPPGVHRLRLANNVSAEFRGNPVDLPGFEARTIAVYNFNAFSLYLGVAGGSGTAEGRWAVIPANRLVVLPLESGIYSIGTDAANVAAAEAFVLVMRFAEVLAPAAYALA